ncbi:MAG: glutamate--tRNA ligase [Firmicutes bacterium]|nr:glutamate--tRNA ligase [Alicyclobacillaceae bacterium]MCL6496028.1 glutamate--tRNA ligase [Bacillota bacterium]
MVRVRYAPSPTGALHIGGARTALFNFLFARHHRGRFVLRVEDTDQTRLVPGSEAAMMAGLKSLGLTWDEGPDVGGDFGPYRQSERLSLYRRYLEQLEAEGKAYRCYCTPEELQAERERQRAQGLPPRYSGRCRHLSATERAARAGRPSVLRLKVPEGGTTVVDDLIRGPVRFEHAVLDDFVLCKTDGTPVYNFAAAVDDHAMAITHVIRGEEHLSNTPKQILVAEALGFALPQYAHVPMILAPDRSKLSKRHGATSVEEYRAQGILPEALVNYLLLLGWSPPDGNELMSLEQAVAAFDLQRVQHTAAIYDQKKLEWMNAQYLRRLSLERVIEALGPFLAAAGVDPGGGPPLAAAVALTRERARTLAELADQLTFFYRAPERYDLEGAAKYFRHPDTAERLEALAERLQPLAAAWTALALGEAFEELAREWGVKRAEIIHPVRLAVTGRTVGPGLFELMEVLGPGACLDRIRRAAQAIRQGVVGR